MGNAMSSHVFLAAAASVVSAGAVCLTPITWGDPRVDLFGVAPDATIWHKFYTGFDWQPFNNFEYLPASVSSGPGCPSATTWGEGRLDVFYVGKDGGNVEHKYFAGGDWNPSWNTSEDLGGEDITVTASAAWGDNRLDIVGLTTNGSYVHKAWTGDGWYPPSDDSSWESLDDNDNFTFFSNPAVVSWGEGRLDVIGLSADDGALLHKYYQSGWSKWENLGGGPFIQNPVATSWGEKRLDFWAIDSEGELNHKYWDGTKWKGWEQLGGSFSDTPKVVHWNDSKIDIVGKGLDDEIFYLKSFDGSKWNPSGKDWHKIAGPFASEPGLLAKHETNFLYIFGIDEEDALQMQIWTGYDWQPGHNRTWSLGSFASGSSGAANGPADTGTEQSVIEL